LTAKVQDGEELMKIRTRLTLFFSIMMFILVLVLSIWYQYRLYFSLRGESIRNLDNYSNSFFRPEPKDKFEPKNVPPKILKPVQSRENLKSLMHVLGEMLHKDQFAEMLGKHMWVVLYDENQTVVEQSSFAEEFPVKNILSYINNAYFTMSIKINSDYFKFDKIDIIPEVMFDNMFYTDKDNYSFNCIGKITKLDFEEGTYYLAVLLPDNKNSDYLQSSLLNAVFSLIFFTGIIILLGLLYSRYSLNPINKIIHELNSITEKNLSERINLNKNNNDELSGISLSINNLLERIENAFNMEKQFISDVSHEFKTPISILQLNIDNISNNPHLSDEEIDKLTSSLEILYSLDFLVRKLLYLSRLESDLCQFSSGLIPVSDLLNSIISNLQGIAEHKNIEFKFLPDDKNLQIEGDRELLYIAFYNIIENAVKYTRKGHVAVQANRIGNGIRITVEDTGIGIPKDKLNNIFDKFFRVDQSRNDTRSFGIGLTITRRILNIHKAEILVESIENIKTVFTVIFKNPVKSG
jgi:signal transduction histidine kinase